MMRLLMRFLPNLVPAIGGLLNPWILLALGGAIVGAFLYGLSVGHDRLEAFEAKVAAVGQAQEERTKQRIANDKRLKKETDDAHDAAMVALGTNLAVLVGRLSVDTGGSLLPAPGTGAGSLETISFDRAELDRALQDTRRRTRENLGRAAILVGEGAAAVTGLDTARKWNASRERGD